MMKSFSAADVLKHAGLDPLPSPASSAGEDGESDPALDLAMDEFHKHFTSGDKKKALKAFRALKDMC